MQAHATLTEMQKRMLGYAAAKLLGDEVSDEEEEELRTMLNEKLKADRQAAIQHALATI